MEADLQSQLERDQAQRKELRRRGVPTPFDHEGGLWHAPTESKPPRYRAVHSDPPSPGGTQTFRPLFHTIKGLASTFPRTCFCAVHGRQKQFIKSQQTTTWQTCGALATLVYRPYHFCHRVLLVFLLHLCFSQR